MYFETLLAAIEMEGHGVYVWSAYLITALALGAIAVSPISRRKRLLREMSGEMRRSDSAQGDA